MSVWMDRCQRAEYDLKVAERERDDLRAQLEACQKEKTAAEEWINAVRGCIFALIEKYPTFNHEWGGDRNGWGFSFEWVKWVLLRAQEAERERDTLLELLRDLRADVCRIHRYIDNAGPGPGPHGPLISAMNVIGLILTSIDAALAAHKEPV